MLSINVHQRTLMDMTTVTATHLKAKLGQFMRAVRAGRSIVITDRERPVARLVPYEGDEPRPAAVEVAEARDPAAPPLGQLKVKGIKYCGPAVVDLLIADRSRR